jgi:acetone carboxylase gamma subunit
MKSTPSIHITNPFKEKQFYIGMSQEGKTNLLCYHLSTSTLPFTLYDTVGAASRKFKPLNPKTQKIIDPTRLYPSNYSMTNPQRIEIKTKRLQLFEATCNRVLDEGNQLFIVDETQEFCTKRTINPAFGDVIQLGGNENVGFMGTSQFIRDVNNDILGNTKHFFIFRTFLKPDVDWLGAFIPKETILMSKDLEPHGYIYYKLGGTPQIGSPVKKMEL